MAGTGEDAAGAGTIMWTGPRPASMASGETVVECSCGFEAGFDRLRDAREALATHEGAGHDADWHIEKVADGVELAGADAGVCGRPECTNEESRLFRDDV